MTKDTILRARGFTLVEMMVSMTIMLLVLSAAGTFYISQARIRTTEQLGITMDANLRLAMDEVAFSIRNVAYGAPTTNVSSWMPWAAGFTANPMLTAGADANTPDTISLALCTSAPIAYLSAGAASGATSITVASAANLDATNKRLIYINDKELAVIQSITGTTVYIDTDPVTAGIQGLSRAYATNTPICRVDVVTYTVDTTNKQLTRDLHQGAGAEAMMDGITNMKITQDTSGTQPKYKVTLTAQSSQTDPTSGAFITRNLTSTASERN